MEDVYKMKYMIDSIDFAGIVTILKNLPKKYHTGRIKVARGKYKLPTTFREAIKKITNG